MVSERWLPVQHQLPDGSRLGQLLHGGPDWQIYRLNKEDSILVAQASLADRWVESALLPDTALDSLTFAKASYGAISSGSEKRLEPVGNGGSPTSKADGLAFALSLRETRKIDPYTPLHDAIYVECLSRLLPTWTVSAGSTDEAILGRWLTGGVAIPATSFRRLSSLLGWLTRQDVADLVGAAGFDLPKGSGMVRTRQKPRGAAHRTADNKMKPAAVPGNEPDSAVPTEKFRLPGRSELEAFFHDHVIDIIQHAERYQSLGIDFPGSMVLHGPPGCGKTFAVERLAEYLDWPVFHVDANSVASPYIHETSKKISEVFNNAMDAAPAMIVIDEMESYLSDRQLQGSAGLHHVEEVTEFLRHIPQANQNQVLVIGMTNRLDMIDPAILRRGRFDHVMEVGMPSAPEVMELVESLLAKVPVEDSVDTETMVEALTDRALSDTAFVIREAARLAARQGKSALDGESLQQALEQLPPLEQKKRPIGFIQD